MSQKTVPMSLKTLRKVAETTSKGILIFAIVLLALFDVGGVMAITVTAVSSLWALVQTAAEPMQSIIVFALGILTGMLLMYQKPAER